MFKKIVIVVLIIVAMGIFRKEMKQVANIVINTGALVYDVTGKIFHNFHKAEKKYSKA